MRSRFDNTPKKKGKKIETFIDHKSGLECDIYLDGTQFTATLLEREFTADNVALVRTKLRDYANHWLTMEWFPIAEVDCSETGYSRGESRLKLEFERYYLSRSPAGEIFKVEWDVDSAHRKAEMSLITGEDRYGRHDRNNKLKIIGLPLTAPVKTGDEKFLIDYSDELWMKLKGIAENIDALSKRLHELISTKQGVAQLLEGSSMLQLENAKPIKGKR